MTQQSIVHIYRGLEEAKAAIKYLSDSKFPIKQISIVTQNREAMQRIHGFIATGDAAAQVAAPDPWTEEPFGLLTGPSFIWAPGFGPLFVAGPFAVTVPCGLKGYPFGPKWGGLLGALLRWGISEEHILQYEENIMGGKCLVIANGDQFQARQARSILNNLYAEQISSTDAEKVL